MSNPQTHHMTKRALNAAMNIITKPTCRAKTALATCIVACIPPDIVVSLGLQEVRMRRKTRVCLLEPTMIGTLDAVLIGSTGIIFPFTYGSKLAILKQSYRRRG